jgi:hypothetical protein
MDPKVFDKLCFWWSEVRLGIAAVALFIGGVPPIYLVVQPSLYPFVGILLKIAWIVSGLTAGYLLYRWYDTGQKLFGHKDHRDLLSFLVVVLSGMNLGFAGLFGQNLGMTVTSSHLVFIVVGFIYIFSAWKLWNGYRTNKSKIF